jgi:hypothetical protein
VTHPTKDEIRDILRPYHGRIRRVFERAWAEWRLVDGLRTENRLGPLLYSRTIANYVFDAIARIGITEFAEDPTVQIKVETQSVKFVFKGKVLARFKKGDESKLGQNNPTQASIAFTEADGMLPGLPPETAKVEFIWRANSIQTQLESVLVISRDGDKIVWGYRIPAVLGKGAIIQFPTPEQQQDTPAGDDDGDELVKPKARDTKKAKKED